MIRFLKLTSIVIYVTIFRIKYFKDYKSALIKTVYVE